MIMKQVQKIVDKTIEKYFIDEKLHEDIAGILERVFLLPVYIFI